MSKRANFSWSGVVYSLMLLVLLVGTGSAQPPASGSAALLPASNAALASARTAPAQPTAPAVAVHAPRAPSVPAAQVSQQPAINAGEEVAVVEPAVAAEIQQKGSASYLLYFRARPDLAAAEKMEWIQRGRFVVQQLQSVAESSQKQVRAYLDGKGISYRSFWIDNVILVEQSDAAVFNELTRFSEIGAIRARRTEKLIEPTSKDPLSSGTFSIEPNIAHVQAPETWALGFTGVGSVVSSVDTGVRYTHQALVGKYRGNLGGGTFNHNYNWWDPYGDHPTAPADDNGHGSHTMGTMVGDDGGNNQIGMAPGAKWIGCRGCNTTSCTDTALLACAQFIAAPWDLTGANPNPDMRPNSVNNSWGDCSQSYDPWYRGVVDSWRAAGIYPVFSNGNSTNCGYTSPPPCGTVGNPARYGNVSGVGATGQQNGAYATFSNRGPTDNADTENGGDFPTIKPQVAAPGSNIRSSVNTGDTAYEGGWSGTSMAAPHVTGLTALIYQAAPCLKGNFTAVENILQQSAAIASGVPGTCAGEDADGVPNQSTGWGEIRALAAVQLALTSCGPMGTLDGSVSSGGGPIAGATVQAIGTENTFQAITDAAGLFSMTLPVGTYQVNVSAYGFMPASIPGVVIQENTTTTLPVVLEPAPSFTVSGKVFDPAAGWGLYATITIDGYPGLPIKTDPATGNYSITLVAGQNYTFHAVPFAAGYLPAALDTGVLAGDLTLDLPVVADANNCVAPGYVLDVTGVYETFEGTFPPTGWTVTKTADSECQWVGNDPGARGNLTGGSGLFAVADSDACGSGTTMNTTMTSPIMDVSALANVNLSYAYDYNNLSSAESADLEVSADGGATWTGVHHWNTDMRGPSTFTQDVTALLGGSTQAQIRYHYVAPGWDWWWEVDNVFVGEKNCHPIGGGGLVVGRVADANDDHALIGATVSSDSGASATAVATADPALGNLYTLFQPAGDHVLTATMTGYSPGTATVTVPTGSVLRQDFSLLTGHLTYAPPTIDETIQTGDSTTVQVVVSNVGGGAASFELLEVSGDAIPFGQREESHLFVEPSKQDAVSSVNLGLPPPPEAQPLAAGDVLQSWTPAGATGPWGISFDGADGSVWVSSPSSSWGGNDKIYEYQPNGTATGRQWPYTAIPHSNGPADLAFNWNTGMVWAMNVNTGVANCIYEIDPATGPTGNKICPQSASGFTTSQRGLAYDPVTDTWFAGGWNDLMVYRFDSSGAVIASKNVGLSVAGLAFNPDTQHLFVLDNSNSKVYVLDVAANFAILGNFPIAGMSGSGGAGLEIDCSGNLWAVHQPSSTVYQVQSGESANLCLGEDVPWLSETPVSATVPPGESVTVNVTLDSTNVAPGVYTAQLRFVHDTPYPVPNMPVTMTASIPPTMGKLAGTVSTNGECDNDPAPLANVPVVVNSAAFTTPLTLTTDANGYYFAWIEQSASPLTVDVNAGADYATGSATGVILNGGQTTIQDFTLRYLEACVTAAPRSILVNLPLGTSTTKPLTLRNIGGAAGNFTFQNVSTGYTPPAAQSVPAGKTVGANFSANPNPPKGDSAAGINAGGTTAGLAMVDSTATARTVRNEPARIVTLGDRIFSGSPNPPVNSTDPNADNAHNVPFGSTTITQSNSQTIVSANSVSCNAGGLHADNHYMRVFDLATFGITSDFAITNVSFGIEQSTPAGATQPVEVRLFTLNGAFVFANLTPIGSATAAVTSQTLTILDVPVTGIAPAGSKLVVDIFTPSGQAAGHTFFVGSNGLGETGPSYLAAADCGVTEPETTASLGFPEMMIVMNVTGMSGGGGPALWLSEVPDQGTLPSDSQQAVVVTFDASKVNEPGTYKASANVLVGNPEDPDEVVDVQTTMVVTAPANWGILKGTVNTLGHCDAHPAPLGGATLTITGTGISREIVTAANGAYELYLPDYGSPYTIQATEPDHLPAGATGIVIVGLGTTTQDLSMRWVRPCVTETPAALAATVEWHQTATLPMGLANSGAAPTPFSISELPGQFIPMGVTGNQFLVVNDGGSNTTAASAMMTALTNLGYTSDLVSSSSSTGIPATMTNYMAVFYAGVPSSGAEQNQLVAYLDAGGRLLIADNDFGYTDKTTVLYQTYFQATYVADSGSKGTIHGVDLEAGTDTDISLDPYPDSFTFGPDGIGIFANTAPRLNWAGMRIARLAYKAVYLAWDFYYAGGSAAGDPVETEILGKVVPWMIASDVDWLSEAPDSGTLVANAGTQTVQVTLNSAAASVLQPGTYTAQLKIETQDPENGTINVPVSMTVNPSPTYGKVWGTVRGLGACDLQPAPLSGAQVQILVGTETITVETDENGHYQHWFTAAYPTIGLNVSAAGHLAESRAIFFWPGDDPRNQEDFDLHWQQPCGSMTPDSLTATVTMGESAELPAVIHNTGWAPLNFSFRAASSGFIPMSGTQAGEDVLLVSGTTAAADAVAASLTRLGFSYNRVTPSTAPPVGTWTSYAAVIWAGSASSSANADLMKSYLDLGGNLLISYYDLGYYHDGEPLYSQYLEATYVADSGSDGTITGADIMAGLNINISADPYPDSFTINGANAVAIFSNDAPKTDLAGLRIAKNGYKAVYLAWNFNFTGTTDAEKDAVLGKAMNWLAPSATWIQPVPVSGSVAEQSELPVAVTLNSADPQITQPGTYQGVLKMANNTPSQGAVAIPVTMVVNPPGAWGKLQGTVTGLGYCDDAPAALANVPVVITYGETTVNLKTDVDGAYSYWFDAAVGSVNIAVNAVDHEAGSASATIVAGQTTTQDFSLRWLKPCSSTTPTSYNVNLALGSTLQQPLTLFNNGAAATDWELLAISTTGVARPITTAPVPGPSHNGALLSAVRAPGEPRSVKSTDPILNGPVSLALDDGSAENSIGVTDGVSSYQFIWMNRFTPGAADFPFNLEQISILWPSGQGATVGNSVELVVYQDIDGDGNPVNAALMGTYNVTIAHTDGTTWDVYTLPDALLLGGPGDVLIGAINRWVTTGVTPAQWPANLDQTASQSRSWAGWWNADPPVPPVLPPDNTFSLIDSLGFAGNWMIRASGTTAAGVIWLTVDPSTGNIAADSQQAVSVTFNAAAEGIQTGIYQATLRYATDDPVSPTISLPVTMNVGLGPHFTVVMPASVVTGVPVNVTVTARNADGSVNTAYAGTVAFTSSDSTAILPPNYTFAPEGDAGAHAFTVTFVESGTQSLIVTDTAASTNTGVAMINVLCATLAATASSNAPVCDGSTLELTVDMIGESYFWTGPNGFTSTLQSPSIPSATALAEGEYTVTVTLPNGCAYTDGTSVVIISDGDTPGTVTITSPNSVAVNSTGNAASVPSRADTSYAWSITGGTITAGDGTNAIEFSAGNPGTTMTVGITETGTTAGCALATGSKKVSVDFLDVSPAHPFREFINTLARNGVTLGCGGGNYCPSEPVTRAQMAMFLLRSAEGANYAPPPATGMMFNDVPIDAFAAAWIEELARRQITLGCGGGNYCPSEAVTRQQMAAFLLKTKEGSTYVPPDAVGMFADVPPGSLFEDWIEELYNRAITSGCAVLPLRYCPTNSVTRGEMAVFLTRTFGLQ